MMIVLVFNLAATIYIFLLSSCSSLNSHTYYINNIIIIIRIIHLIQNMAY